MEEIIIIGSGMGSLTTAALLAKAGLKPLILEQNWIPGGCTTSYPRKGYVFEAGATTLVGLDKDMPLRYLLDQTGIEIRTRKLDLPMQVHLTNGATINRYEDIDQWIKEAEIHFGGNQKRFWQQAYFLSKFVWNASTRFRRFPPANLKDVLALAKSAKPFDLINARFALKSTQSVLAKFRFENVNFQSFVNEQLLITAQNHAEEVNHLFGAAALCYTNYSNHYIDGGLINLMQPIIEYIESKGGRIIYRDGVQKVNKTTDGYRVFTKNTQYDTHYLISGVPLNNLMDIAPDLVVNKQNQLLKSDQLYSAFQMGIAFKAHKSHESIHHQIHLDHPLAITGSKSIFLSLSHPEDHSRAKDGATIASVSMHIPHPQKTIVDSQRLEQELVRVLDSKGFIKKENIIFAHSSGPKSWHKWTGRKFGFVGGYPQYFKTKPWQMVECRLDDHRAYMCGDTAYPGQGIPGATLSGIIAAEKLSADWL